MRDIGRVAGALSDPLRRDILQRVARYPDTTVMQICRLFPVSRFAVMRHLNELEKAGLITRTMRGRERHIRLADDNPAGALIDWLNNLYTTTTDGENS